MPPSLCCRYRIGTPPSTQTRSIVTMAGRSLTAASRAFVSIPVKAAVRAFSVAPATLAGEASSIRDKCSRKPESSTTAIVTARPCARASRHPARTAISISDSPRANLVRIKQSAVLCVLIICQRRGNFLWNGDGFSQGFVEADLGSRREKCRRS